MFRYRRQLIAAWPGHWSFPRKTRRRSWGSVAPFAGLLPHTGGGSFLIGPGPPACSSSRRAPIDFRRVDSPLLQKMHESRYFAADHVRLDWLLGFDSRLRSVSPSPATTLWPFRACGIVPALGLSSLRCAGTTSVHSDGLDPVRIIKPRRRYPRRHSALGLTFAWCASTIFARRTRELPFSVLRPDALPLRALRNARNERPV